MLSAYRSRATHTHSNGVRNDRPMGLRLLAGAAAVLLVFAAVSCSPSRRSAPTAPGSGTASPSSAIRTAGAVAIPTGNLDAYAQCMVDAGWQITAVHSAPPGEPPGYEMTHPGQIDPEIRARTQQCYTLAPSPRWPSDAEIRVIYNRYVDEYHCLVGLGYQPDPPPSVETFVASYKTGPWSPIDGTGWESWSQAQYDAARAKCTIEMLIR